MSGPLGKPEKKAPCFKPVGHLLDEPGPLKDDWTAGGSHDLRTSLALLGWSLKNLLDGLAGELNNRQREYLEAMDQAVRQLDWLISGDPAGAGRVRDLGLERERSDGTQRHGSDS